MSRLTNNRDVDAAIVGLMKHSALVHDAHYVSMNNKVCIKAIKAWQEVLCMRENEEDSSSDDNKDNSNGIESQLGHHGLGKFNHHDAQNQALVEHNVYGLSSYEEASLCIHYVKSMSVIL